MQALTDPPGSAFKVSESRVRGAVAWPEPGLQEPQPPILAVNFVIEANQDGDECPGVMLALDRGGSCVGIVYKVIGPDLRSKIIPVWRREMRGNGYLARWVSAITAEGPVRAITFVVNRASERYAGRLSDEEIADQIALACGHIGPSAEYLLNTVARCEDLGVHDPYLWRMQALVAERMNAVWQL